MSLACRRKSRTANTGWASSFDVRELTLNGHLVIVLTGPLGAGIADADYRAVGAEIVSDADQIFGRGELIVKVKEPLAIERKNPAGQVLFTYLHLAADPEQTAELMASGVIAIAYETVTSAQGTLPLLTPMSEVAGRMAPHVGARCLRRTTAAAGCCLEVFRGSPPRTWSCSAAASPAPRRR